MDRRTLLRTARALVDEIEATQEPNWGYSIRELLNHGEEGMAVDYLLRGLIKNKIPVTPIQRDTLSELVAYFPPPDGGWSRHVPYLVIASIDRLRVVDE